MATTTDLAEAITMLRYAANTPEATYSGEACVRRSDLLALLDSLDHTDRHVWIDGQQYEIAVLPKSVITAQLRPVP